MTKVMVMREIDPAARVAPDAKIGLYCTVGPNVTIGPRTVLERRVSVTGDVTIGSGNFFAEGCVLGGKPQDLKYRGGSTLLMIGHRNRFDQDVTAHLGTEEGGWLTRIGDENILMAGCHIAHDCYVDDRVTLGKKVFLAGHILVECGAVIDDMVGVVHFATIGRYARVCARTPVRRDVPPYTEFFGANHGESAPSVRGVHKEGIAAANFSTSEQHELRVALRELFDDESALQTKIEQLVNMGVDGEAAALCSFCQRSLQGIYGRQRELYRGISPPEAAKYLPAQWRRRIRSGLL